MRHVRAAWNVVAGLHPMHVPAVNPFMRLDLERPAKGGGVKPATRDQLETFIAAAISRAVVCGYRGARRL